MANDPMPTLAPPAERLPAAPKLKTADDVRIALAELSWLDSEQKRIEAEAKREVESVKIRYAGRQVVTVEGNEWTMADRAKALAAAVETFCEKNRDKLLAEDVKSREFTHGVIGWRKAPAAVDFIAGKDDKALTETVEKACGLRAAIAAVLAKLFPLPKLAASLFFDVTVKLNRSRVKHARETGLLTDAQLRKLGLAYDAGAESFYVKVNDYAVQREADA